MSVSVWLCVLRRDVGGNAVTRLGSSACKTKENCATGVGSACSLICKLVAKSLRRSGFGSFFLQFMARVFFLLVCKNAVRGNRKHKFDIVLNLFVCLKSVASLRFCQDLLRSLDICLLCPMRIKCCQGQSKITQS